MFSLTKVESYADWQMFNIDGNEASEGRSGRAAFHPLSLSVTSESGRKACLAGNVKLEPCGNWSSDAHRGVLAAMMAPKSM